ncbi:MAG: hypothetical protein H8E48_10625 [Chloroflexi bacterium]|nr:hypothetical protein [Chloroflexota bacterium]
MRLLTRTRLFTLLMAAVLFSITAGAVMGHERRDVDKYTLVVGFIVEPAFEGIKNGIDLRISTPGAVEGETVPVEGLEETLQVELTHVPSDASRVLDLRTIFRDPGHYTSDLILTAPGVYQMRVFGSIEGLAVDETFISRGGGGSFGDVESSVELQFPEALPEARELEGAIRGVQGSIASAQDLAVSADDSASTAQILGILGIVVGTLGTAVGGGALIVATKK